MARDFSAGDVLAQKFRLVSQLGAGGMGSVWRAEHLLLRSPVAIKLIHERVASAPGAVDRFLPRPGVAAVAGRDGADRESGGPRVPSSSDACAKACAKLQACGYKCPAFPCVGPYKAIADCVNGKSSCLEMAGCSK
jgi:serine/threonine protein kinase